MSATSKSIFSFLAGAATVVAAGAFLSSKNGKKVKKNVVNRLRNFKKETQENINTDWFNDISDSALHSARTFRKKVKL
ncbi:hypothetical protein [Marivirga arenosa]|uniref:YtxH-like protein n=1 Tax=Marivirga arenosa TaxID=3059076 RepID=A0AA49GGY6_9BACT|nr:hypothetical protein [Marivirga sp. BKB1-2]WKK81555.1 hypothetical protein QYS47_04515 [Marivirga sp. BKB1-2]